ncbi:hypothetical protein GGF46_003340 [Coemansia sp. RSA 552]|nr:hypothetical protein GGF46_003340 [Coemansia sp. RSA 552]
MRDPRAHFTEPTRAAAPDPADLDAARSGTYSPGAAQRPAVAGSPSSSAAETVADVRGCVPTHRSVFRLFRRKTQARARGLAAGMAAGGGDTVTSTSTVSSGEHGGYMRSRKGTRGTTLSAQRTRSELAVAGPPPAPRENTDRQQLTARGSARALAQAPAQARLHRTDKGTIVPLGSAAAAALEPAIPAVDDVHGGSVPADDADYGGDSAPASLGGSVGHATAAAAVAASASATDMTELVRQLSEEVELAAASEPEPEVDPDDGSDWNSDFSSPTSWRRGSDRASRAAAMRALGGHRLADRAIDRGVLEAQHRILQQERYLMQISALSSSLARLRPLILRCLVFELPDRAIQIGTTTFVSALREPGGSVEPSVEEERLWELWRQAEALLTIMDNDAMPPPAAAVEARLTLSKKRAIMLAFCDWEQYSLYVQDAWDKARRGILQPPSSPHDALLRPPPSRVSSRYSLARQRRARRRSVVTVAPASLQRIADDARAVHDECDQLLGLMSPLYRSASSSDKPPAETPPPLLRTSVDNPSLDGPGLGDSGLGNGPDDGDDPGLADGFDDDAPTATSCPKC